MQNKISRRLSRQFNVFNIKNIFDIPMYTLLAMLSIFAISLISLYSSDGGNFFQHTFKQICYMIFSLLCFVLIISLNVIYIMDYAYLFLFAMTILLALVIPLGRNIMGASRWLNLGFISLQPSEFAKLAIILALAKFYSKIPAQKIYKISTTFKAIMIVFVPIVLTAIQPDLATSTIMFSLTVIIIFISGTPRKQFYIAGVLALISIPIAWIYALKDYQKLRILNFLIPGQDILGSGYNVNQSKIAIGSGGLIGKGFLHGSQGQLKFIPEHHTDFIFTIVCEEFGFIGATILIGCYVYLIYYGLLVATKTNSVFGKITAIGCSSLLFLHTFINIAMTIGLMPVAGIPLLMMSYGGCGLLLGTICVALMVSVDMHKNLF